MHPVGCAHLTRELDEPEIAQQAPEAGCEVILVAGELLIRALAVEHDLDLVAGGELEDVPLGVNAGRAERLVLVPSNAIERRKQLVEARANVVRVGTRAAHDLVDELALVEARDARAGGEGLL